MACNCGGGLHAVPWVRLGLPTVWAWGPFTDYEVVDYADLENVDLQQQE